MNLRIATINDLDLVTTMAMNFVNSSQYKGHADEVKIRSLAEELVTVPAQKAMVLLYEDKGMIAGMAAPFLFSDDLVCTEIAWWVEPEHRKSSIGKELLDGLEYWAANIANCKIITMISIDEELGKYYEKRGYTLKERVYTKWLDLH